MIADFFRYLLKSGNRHSLHSPFVYDFYEEVIRSKDLPFDSKEIELRFNHLKADKRVIEVKDLGAGSKFGNGKTKKVGQISRASSKSGKWAAVLARIVLKYNYRTVIELGTSVGFTTTYLSRSVSYGKVYTFEGCPETLKVAKENFKLLNCDNVVPILGDIDQTLKTVLQQVDRVDLVFFDANHQYDATMKYFHRCLEKADENSCFVFDDIYWSEGMKKAWGEIKLHPKVTLSLDFFQIGIVFFRPKQPRQNFVLRTF